MKDFSPKEPILLIVDDARSNLQILRGLLKSLKCRVTAAINGAQVFKILENLTPDLILLDIMMPEMDGYEVCQRLKTNPETRDIPVIFITAKTETEHIVKGFQLGAVDYVTKPFNKLELLARVNTQLAIKRQNDLIREQNCEQRELLHVLCHDLTNPLASLSLALEMLEEDLSTYAEMKGFMRNSVKNATEIIDMIRHIRALEEKKISLDNRPHNLLETVNTSLAILRHRFEKKNVRHTVKIDPSLQAVFERVSFVNSVLNNIFTNAIKFSYPEQEIEIEALEENGQIQLRIQDYGIGIAEEALKDIFNVAKQTSRSGTRGEKGTGFGMPLIKKFVTSYGGRIDVESHDEETYPEKHGTSVYLFLKTADQPIDDNIKKPRNIE